MKRAVFLSTFLLAVVLGIVSVVYAIVWLVGLLLFLIAVIVVWRYDWALPLFFCMLLGFGCGWIRTIYVTPSIDQTHIAYWSGQVVTVHGRVVREVERRIDQQRVTVLAEQIVVDGQLHFVDGLVLVFMPLYPVVVYDDVVEMNIELKRPQALSKSDTNRSVFEYDKYLQRYGILVTAYFPKSITIVNHYNSILGQLFAIKRWGIHYANYLLPEPHSSFLGGLLWGGKRAMSPEILSVFSRTGTTHIIALSGFNIAIIGVFIFAIAPWLHIPRHAAFWFTLIGIIFFVVITGAQPSVIRAAIMGVLVLVAYYIGRPRTTYVLIVIAAAIMAWIQPLVVRYDVGFLLSFLATISLVYLGPIVHRVCRWVPTTYGIQEVVQATLSATVATLPLSAGVFGIIPVYGLIVNILIVPMIPIVMACGALLLVIAPIAPMVIDRILQASTWFLLEYCIRVAMWWSAMPGSVIDVPEWFDQSVAGYCYIGASLFFVWYYRSAIRQWFLYAK